jgi:hypothetical protein
MAPEQPDKVQREIEELLDRLDNFVPEERLTSKIKRRRKEQAGPNVFERAWAPVRKYFTRVTLGHVMLAGLALMLLGWLAPGLFFGYSSAATIVGILLLVAAFVASFLGWDSRRTIAGGNRVERRWRGQVVDYEEPERSNKLRDWFRRRR